MSHLRAIYLTMHWYTHKSHNQLCALFLVAMKSMVIIMSPRNQCTKKAKKLWYSLLISCVAWFHAHIRYAWWPIHVIQLWGYSCLSSPLRASCEDNLIKIHSWAPHVGNCTHVSALGPTFFTPLIFSLSTMNFSKMSHGPYIFWCRTIISTWDLSGYLV